MIARVRAAPRVLPSRACDSAGVSLGLRRVRVVVIQHERLKSVIDDVASDSHSPDRERLIRVCRAVREELRLLEQRIVAQDPATIAAHAVRPLAEVEHEHVLAAVRAMGSVSAAALALGVGTATVYRHLQRASKPDLEGIEYRRGGADIH